MSTVTMGHPLDHATGIEKREMLARMAGDDDPFTQNPIKGGRCATRDKPYEVPSVNDYRIVGCICCDEANSINFMTVYKGHPTRCECGYWFCLVPATPL